MDKTKIAVELFNKYAQIYQDKFMDISLYSESFDLFCNAIQKKNAHVLEIACGPGNITKYLFSKRPDFVILGIDLADKMIELARINNPQATFQLMDCRDIHLIEKKFDAIMCGFGLPYLSKEEAIQFIVNASNLMEANGLLYISTMEDDYHQSGFRTGSTGDQMYLHFHQADYLTETLEKNNFKIIDLQRKKYAIQDGTETNDLLILAEKTT
jgi:predicted TPR repeat methyltransferase